MHDPKPNIFVFSPFRMDPARRILTRDGLPIALKPKEFDTLLVLVQEDGRVVDKDDLMSRVWPDCYVAEGSLAKNISILRKVLGEAVIETHRGRGYRIILPIVTTSSIAAVPLAEPSQILEPPPQLAERLSTAANPALSGKQRSWTRRALQASALAAAILLASVAYRFVTIKTATAHPMVRSIFIEQSGGLDPLEEGFKLQRPDEGFRHIMANSDNTGFDRWRVVTRYMNFYYRKLTDDEKRFALRTDWKLTCVCALERGAGSSDLDLGPGIGPRFDIAYLQENDKYFVVLTTQISPHYEFHQKIEFPGLADIDHPHTFQLRFDHLTQTASLWIDGQFKASGYRGHRQYQENWGFMFGAATYRDMPQSSMVFRDVRFEAK